MGSDTAKFLKENPRCKRSPYFNGKTTRDIMECGLHNVYPIEQRMRAFGLGYLFEEKLDKNPTRWPIQNAKITDEPLQRESIWNTRSNRQLFTPIMSLFVDNLQADSLINISKLDFPKPSFYESVKKLFASKTQLFIDGISLKRDDTSCENMTEKQYKNAVRHDLKVIMCIMYDKIQKLNSHANIDKSYAEIKDSEKPMVADILRKLNEIYDSIKSALDIIRTKNPYTSPIISYKTSARNRISDYNCFLAIGGLYFFIQTVEFFHIIIIRS